MGSAYLFVGFLFLINPDLFTLDFLPDAIGYFLISTGLRKAAFLEDRIATARRFFRYLIWVSIVKILSIPSVLTTTVENTRMTVCFFFFIVETWLLFVAVSNTFKGVQYLAIRKDGDLTLKGYETANFFVTAFVFVKAVCAFLPPSLAIFVPNIDADPDVAAVDRGAFVTMRTLLFAISAVIMLFFGIYVAFILRAYLKRIRSDAMFCKNLRADYEEKVTKNEALQIRLAYKDAFRFFLLSFLCLADLYLDDIGLIPTFLSPLFALLGVRRLHPYLKKDAGLKKLPLKILPTAFFVSFAAYAYRTVLLILTPDPAAFALRVVRDPISQIAGGVTGLLCAAAFTVVLRTVASTAKEHADYPYRVYGIILLVISCLCCILGFFQYSTPSTYSILPSVQWVLWAVGVYLHHKTMDEIRAETDHKLM